jgi:hypothetical protein
LFYDFRTCCFPGWQNCQGAKHFYVKNIALGPGSATPKESMQGKLNPALCHDVLKRSSRALQLEQSATNVTDGDCNDGAVISGSCTPMGWAILEHISMRLAVGRSIACVRRWCLHHLNDWVGQSTKRPMWLQNGATWKSSSLAFYTVRTAQNIC